MLRFPQHRSVDAIASTGVIVKDDAFQRARADLAVFAEPHGGLGETVRLARNVDTVVVRLGFVRANDAD